MKKEVSALVFCHNEAHLLEACLESIKWCDEILVVDMESSDNPRILIEKYGTYTTHPKVNWSDELFPAFIPTLKHDWVLLIDPDEVLSESLKLQLNEILDNVEDDVAKINVPCVFYFKKHPLRGTIWGGNRHVRMLINRNRVEITTAVHASISLLQGMRIVKIKRNGENIDHHFWASNWRSLVEKHRRYLLGEGQRMSVDGHKYSFRRKWVSAYSSFWNSFVQRRGYLDGWLGFKLSLFWSWYNYAKWNALRDFESGINRQRVLINN
jgi:glycosyltransferase involved in cell wall biosynthesis